MALLEKVGLQSLNKVILESLTAWCIDFLISNFKKVVHEYKSRHLEGGGGNQFFYFSGKHCCFEDCTVLWTAVIKDAIRE